MVHAADDRGGAVHAVGHPGRRFNGRPGRPCAPLAHQHGGRIQAESLPGAANEGEGQPHQGHERSAQWDEGDWHYDEEL